ncbi:hypothetical protein [Spongiactinospora sp. TRM90649]|uniref:hypothetical protein n=1 Tax=Spongiactinospora sp. TRM90649 TaxID=3031114 RepID=UPI0023FA0F9A|nr:hypothetical protein [Spongiactinospora sp. TRM90649]MDF5758986.1 hypothetical protein [Spongiactinospora sp. TRM90649]
MTTDIDRMVADLARDPGPGMTPGARALLDEITATATPVAAPAPTRRLRLPRLVLPVVVALVTALVTFAGGPSPAQALEIERQGAFFTITVIDAYADPGQYQEQLSRAGIRLAIQLKAAPVSRVGQIVVPDARIFRATGVPSGADGRITAIAAWPDCGRAGCPIGLRVPVDYRGGGVILLGRPARPGERYETLAPIDDPGEPLFRMPYARRSVSAVEAMLREKGVVFFSYTTSQGPKPDVPGSWYVHAGVLTSSDTALLRVSRAI